MEYRPIAFPVAVRELRAELGDSQAEFAAKVGVSQPTVSEWETGRATPGPAAVKAMAELVGEKAEDVSAMLVVERAALLAADLDESPAQIGDRRVVAAVKAHSGALALIAEDARLSSELREAAREILPGLVAAATRATAQAAAKAEAAPEPSESGRDAFGRKRSEQEPTTRDAAGRVKASPATGKRDQFGRKRRQL